MPVDSSPTAGPQYNDSAADLTDNKELKRNGMRITFKVHENFPADTIGIARFL